jgi:ABC-2 type transport system ATP-binding protein
VIGVNDISIELPAGAYGLLGPNGSGKSTLLNLIMGQLRPSLGTVRVFGEAPFGNDALFRRIGFCPSGEGLYASVCGLEWVTYLQQLQGKSNSAAKAAAERALEMVGLTDAMHREISGYSRGMRQRTKLAQAIAHDPQFLILDEPFNGLDPIGRHDMTMALRGWISQGRSLLLASHLLHEVESVTQSFLLICGGRLLASGTAEEVQAMLVDLPSELAIRTNKPRQLAKRIVALEVADQIRIDADRVTVSTHLVRQLLFHLPDWADSDGLQIHEVRSGDESLLALFNTLLKIHRGEI